MVEFIICDMYNTNISQAEYSPLIKVYHYSLHLQLMDLLISQRLFSMTVQYYNKLRFKDIKWDIMLCLCIYVYLFEINITCSKEREAPLGSV